MNSYLSNRKQIVKLEDKKSTEKEIQTDDTVVISGDDTWAYAQITSIAEFIAR